MGRGINWKRTEIEIILNNYADMTTKELADILPGRSEKAINRKIEKLRDSGKIGLRTDETVRRAYYQRETKKNLRNKNRFGSKRRLPVSDDYEPVD